MSEHPSVKCVSDADEVLRRYTLRQKVLNRIDSQVAHNLAKWGEDQDALTLVAVIAEETGEVARAVLEFNHRGDDVGPLRSLQLVEQIAKEAIQLAAVCVEIARVGEDEATRLEAKIQREHEDAMDEGGVAR